MLPPRQYYVTSSEPEPVPDGYRSESVDEWHLVFDDSFDSLPVVVGGDHVGHVIGTILDVRGRCEDGELRLSEAGPGTLREQFQDALFELAGHYLGVIEADEPYAYTDPIGGCPVVYEPNEGVAGATPASLPNVDHRARFRTELFDRLNPNLDNIFLPGKNTYYSGVKRHLPNHRLNLDTWEATRYWPPSPGAVSTDDDATATAEFIGTTLREIFAEIVSTYDRPVAPLTAGLDSRSLLAAARPWLTDGTIGTITWDTGEQIDVDRDIARRLSAGREFDWTPVPVVTATDDEKQRWLEDTGYAVGGTIMDIHPTLEAFDADLHVNGFGGAIARGKYWSESDEPDTSLSAAELLHRLHKPDHPVLEDAVEDWLAGVQEFDAFTQLDLVTQELRYGSWAGPHFPGLSKRRDVVSPLCYGPIVRAMHRLPVEVRRAGTVQHVIVDRFWSELNEYPYNMYTDWREYVRRAKGLRYKARFVLARPRFAYSFLARKFAGK